MKHVIVVPYGCNTVPEGYLNYEECSPKPAMISAIRRSMKTMAAPVLYFRHDRSL